MEFFKNNNNNYNYHKLITDTSLYTSDNSWFDADCKTSYSASNKKNALGTAVKLINSCDFY